MQVLHKQAGTTTTTTAVHREACPGHFCIKACRFSLFILCHNSGVPSSDMISFIVIDTFVSYEPVSDCTGGNHETMRNIQTEQHSDSHRGRAGFGHFLQRGAAFCLPIPPGTRDLLYFVYRHVAMTSKQRLSALALKREMKGDQNSRLGDALGVRQGKARQGKGPPRQHREQ